MRAEFERKIESYEFKCLQSNQIHKQEIFNLKDKIVDKDKEILNYEKELIWFRE